MVITTEYIKYPDKIQIRLGDLYLSLHISEAEELLINLKKTIENNQSKTEQSNGNG